MSEETQPYLPKGGTTDAARANEESEGSWRQKSHSSEREPLIGCQTGAKYLRLLKPNILSVTFGSTEGGWALTKIAILPGEDPLALGRCNYDTLSPK